jgi:prolyl-tRNA editing enzyme YbaK/EbsC (Cys-tRNA(Pro) deacylase)
MRPAAVHTVGMARSTGRKNPTMALVPGDRRLDEQRLARAAGGRRVQRPDAEAVRAATGFPIGGVPPIGHDLRIYIDEGILDYDVVWAAAGTWTDVFPITPAELVTVTDGTVCALSSSPED